MSQFTPKETNCYWKSYRRTEANEEALKTDRAYTGRKKILSFKNTYHGQSFATITVGFCEYADAIVPLIGSVVRIDYPNTYRTKKEPEKLLSEFAKKIEKILKKRDIAAIITEAGIITGWGSTYLAPKGYLKVVRKLTQKYGTLLILDEVGTGFSRCGKLYGIELEGVILNIITSTFGWNPPSCAVALKVLQIHQKEKIWEKAKKDGKYLMQSLIKELGNHPKMGNIRGIGMEVGIDFVKDKKTKEPDEKFAKRVISKTYKNCLHLVLGDSGNIQLMPSLTIEKSILSKGIEILSNTVKKLS